MTGEPSKGELILYRTEDGRAAIRLRAVDGTVWLTQAEIAVLLDNTPQNVTQHLRTIYADRELDEAATCKDLLQVQQEGDRSVQRSVKTYNLDAILAVGYRVRSPRKAQRSGRREHVVRLMSRREQRAEAWVGWGSVRSSRSNRPRTVHQ